MNKYTQGLEEEIAIIGLIIIAVASIFIMGAGGSELVSAIAGGLVGYIRGATK